MNPGVVVALIVLASIVIIAVTVGVIIYFVGKARKKRAEEEAKNKKTYVYTPKPKKPQITEEERKEKKANAHNRKLLELSNLGKIESSKYKVESNGGDIEAVGIIYNKNSKSYLFNPNGLKLNVGDVVKVKDQNDNIRTVVVVIANQLFKDEDIVKPFKEILEVVYKADSSKVVVEEKKLEPVEEPKEEAKPEEINPEEEVQEEPVVEESEAIKPQEEEKVEEAQAEPRPEVKEEPQPEETQPVEEVKEEAKPEEEASPVEKEKPAEPVQEEPQEEDKPEESEADEEAEDDDSDDDSDEEESPKEETQSQSNASSEVEYDEATKQYKITKIKKTYECKLCQLPDDSKNAYDLIKNQLLSYGLKLSKTKSAEKFKVKKDVLAVVKVSGKQIALYLALEPAKFEGSKYKGKDMSEKKAYEKTPFLYKAKTERKTKWALELIDELAKAKELTKNPDYKNEDFKKDIPAYTEEELIEKGYMTKTVTISNEAPNGFHKVEEI
ncbi:MAG: hypothetical protein IJR67_00535 [Acholeplasmatales bacterium]|nr:hypothetical protein [Acholeplasmatales bacterium]